MIRHDPVYSWVAPFQLSADVDTASPFVMNMDLDVMPMIGAFQ